MIEHIKDLSAKIKNVFSPAEFQRRYDDGTIQVRTRNNKVVEKKESFPYGFCAKAKNGKTFVFCQGGNTDGFEILPLMPQDNVKQPELNEGDTALYTEAGGFIVLRDNGTIELFGENHGGVIIAKELVTNLNKITTRIDAIINALNNSPIIPQDGGASFKTGIVTALNSITDKENFSNIENKKVLHGTGN